MEWIGLTVGGAAPGGLVFGERYDARWSLEALLPVPGRIF